MKRRIFWSFSSVRLKSLRNLSSVLPFLPELPHAVSSPFLRFGGLGVLQLASVPGTYFLTQGYIGDRGGSVFSDYDRVVKKYGREKAEKLMAKMLGNYNRLAYIRLPNVSTLEADREYSRTVAARFNMRYEEIDGTTRLLKRMLEGD